MSNAQMFEEFAAGEDDDFDGEVGAITNLLNRVRAKQGRSPVNPRRVAASLPRLQAPPVINTGPAGLSMKTIPLGLGTVTFTAASGTSLSAEVEPQRGYTPKRLVAALTRTGASATGSVKLTSLKIGDIEQLPSSNGCPASMFDAQATDAHLDLSPATPGMKVVATWSISAAPAGADTVVLDAGFYGKAVGQ